MKEKFKKAAYFLLGATTISVISLVLLKILKTIIIWL